LHCLWINLLSIIWHQTWLFIFVDGCIFKRYVFLCEDWLSSDEGRPALAILKVTRLDESDPNSMLSNNLSKGINVVNDTCTLKHFICFPFLESNVYSRACLFLFLQVYMMIISGWALAAEKPNQPLLDYKDCQFVWWLCFWPWCVTLCGITQGEKHRLPSLLDPFLLGELKA